MVQTKKKPFYFLKNKKKILDIQNLKKLYYQTLQSLKKFNPEELNQLEKKYNNNNKNNNKLNILFSIFNNFNSNEYGPLAPNNLSKLTIKELKGTGKNKCFGDYIVINEIGAGAFGKAVLVEKNKKKYIIKIQEIHNNYKLIKNEILIAKKMGEEKIGPKIYDYYLCKKSGKSYIYIIMDYMNQGTLYQWLETNTLTKKLKKKLNNLINKLHKNIIHGDLHSNNILVNKKNGNIQFYIADFGLSNYLDDLYDIKKREDFRYIENDLNFIMYNKYNLIIAKLFINNKLI